ncbi:conserved hypothetical protein [Burkholderia pseudomallei 576]|nr:conserved hypothetical protein [Burkholderia pseudomallei 576]
MRRRRRRRRLRGPVPRRPVSAHDAGRCGREVGLKRVRTAAGYGPRTARSVRMTADEGQAYESRRRRDERSEPT